MLLENGSTDYNVLILQNGLSVLNYDVGKIDGVYGDKTEQAVKSYQSDHGLASDGIVGNLTWQSLCDSIKALQSKLNEYGAGIIVDGIVGANTKNAIIRFQLANGLSADGIVGTYTMAALESGCAMQINNSCGIYNISDKGINFIADYEDYYAEPYRGLDYQNRTIGYGHVIKDGENLTYLTKAEAKELLVNDLASYVAEVNNLVSGLDLKQHEFDALVSFGYNCGTGGLAESSLLRDIKSGCNADTIRQDFMKWCMCNGERALGLYRRRNDEANIYTKGIYERTYINF